MLITSSSLFIRFYFKKKKNKKNTTENLNTDFLKSNIAKFKISAYLI